MVSYQRFVGIVFDEADDDVEATDLMKWAAARWNRNKETLNRATVSEARELVRRSL